MVWMDKPPDQPHRKQCTVLGLSFMWTVDVSRQVIIISLTEYLLMRASSVWYLFLCSSVMIPDSSKLMAITNGDQREQGSTCVDVISKYFQMMTNQIENVGQVEPRSADDWHDGFVSQIVTTSAVSTVSTVQSPQSPEQLVRYFWNTPLVFCLRAFYGNEIFTIQWRGFCRNGFLQIKS